MSTRKPQRNAINLNRARWQLRAGVRVLDHAIVDGVEWWLHPTKGWRRRRLSAA